MRTANRHTSELSRRLPRLARPLQWLNGRGGRRRHQAPKPHRPQRRCLVELRLSRHAVRLRCDIRRRGSRGGCGRPHRTQCRGFLLPAEKHDFSRTLRCGVSVPLRQRSVARRHTSENRHDDDVRAAVTQRRPRREDCVVEVWADDNSAHFQQFLQFPHRHRLSAGLEQRVAPRGGLPPSAVVASVSASRVKPPRPRPRDRLGLRDGRTQLAVSRDPDDRASRVLRACLASLAASTRLPAEVVVVDQSADASAADVLAAFPQLASRAVRSHPPGIARAMNDGLAQASRAGFATMMTAPSTRIGWRPARSSRTRRAQRRSSPARCSRRATIRMPSRRRRPTPIPRTSPAGGCGTSCIPPTCSSR